MQETRNKMPATSFYLLENPDFPTFFCFGFGSEMC